MNQNFNKLILLIVSALASGLLFYWSTGFHNLWYLLWIAPTPILIYSYRNHVYPSCFAAFIAFFIGSLNLFAYLKTEMPLLVILLPLFATSLSFALLFNLNAVVVKRFNHWTSIFLFPSLWTSYEFILSFFAPSGPINSLAFSQLSFLSFSQLASVTGIWGMTFVTLLFASGISYAISFKHKKSCILALISSLTIVLMVIIYGVIRLQIPAVLVGETNVGLASIQAPIHVTGKKAVQLTNQYITLIHTLAAQGAKFIVLPERIVMLDNNNSNEVLNNFKQAALTNNVTLVVGVARMGERNYNSALILGPNGNILGVYDKQHLVIGLESMFSAGKQPFIVKNSPSWGVAICKDMDFSQLNEEYSKTHVQAMLIPGLDFNVDAWVHARVTVMRGIENGFAVARAANNGLLSVSDQYGKILAKTSVVNQKVAILAATIPLYQIKTLYSEWGNWFGWVSLFIALLLTTLGFTRQTQDKKHE